MDSGHSILNFKTQGSMLMLGVQEEKQELQDSEHRAVVPGCCCGLAECLWTCPWGLLFFPLGQGIWPRSSMWQFRAIWRTFTAVSLKTLCQQLPSSVAPTFHELFILLCVPLWPAGGQEGEGQPTQCLPCWVTHQKGYIFLPKLFGPLTPPGSAVSWMYATGYTSWQSSISIPCHLTVDKSEAKSLIPPARSPAKAMKDRLGAPPVCGLVPSPILAQQAQVPTFRRNSSLGPRGQNPPEGQSSFLH